MQPLIIKLLPEFCGSRAQQQADFESQTAIIIFNFHFLSNNNRLLIPCSQTSVNNKKKTFLHNYVRQNTKSVGYKTRRYPILVTADRMEHGRPRNLTKNLVIAHLSLTSLLLHSKQLLLGRLCQHWKMDFRVQRENITMKNTSSQL